MVLFLGHSAETRESSKCPIKNFKHQNALVPLWKWRLNSSAFFSRREDAYLQVKNTPYPMHAYRQEPGQERHRQQQQQHKPVRPRFSLWARRSVSGYKRDAIISFLLQNCPRYPATYSKQDWLTDRLPHARLRPTSLAPALECNNKRPKKERERKRSFFPKEPD